MTFRLKPIAVSLIAPAVALAATALHAQQERQQPQQDRPQAQAQSRQGADSRLGNWDAQRLYRNTWSAEEMIDTDVRGQAGEEIGEVKDIVVGQDGRITQVIVEVGGFLEIGDQHIGVPWRDVRIGENMQFVQVPLREVENGTYSLHGRIPQGEEVATALTSWRVNELIGDYASLEDNPRYGIVRDLIFNDRGEAQGIIVQRGAGPWGRGGWYGYPYYGFSRGAYAYPLPYRTSQLGEAGRFDYIQLAEQSRYSSGKSTRAEQQARAEQRQRSRQGGAAAGGATQEGATQNDLPERRLVPTR